MNMRLKKVLDDIQKTEDKILELQEYVKKLKIQKKQMEEMEIPLEEDGTLLLQRKIMPGKSICRINGETVSVSQLKELSGCLMDMYGQHEHQTLLKPLAYGKILDQRLLSARKHLRRNCGSIRS